jgi:vacuolar-type H+-ATPase subunit I/STV1
MDEPLSTRDLVKVLRLREGGGMTLKDALATVILSRYSREEYSKIYEYHDTVLRDLRDINDGDSSKDPFESIKERMADIRTREEELAKEKANIKEAVRTELLKDLLMRKEV